MRASSNEVLCALQAIWTEVYSFWKQRKHKLGKPLSRRFWPVTSANDTDPHKVFRPREKERYKVTDVFLLPMDRSMPPHFVSCLSATL